MKSTIRLALGSRRIRSPPHEAVFEPVRQRGQPVEDQRRHRCQRRLLRIGDIHLWRRLTRDFLHGGVAVANGPRVRVSRRMICREVPGARRRFRPALPSAGQRDAAARMLLVGRRCSSPGCRFSGALQPVVELLLKCEVVVHAIGELLERRGSGLISLGPLRVVLRDGRSARTATAHRPGSGPDRRSAPPGVVASNLLDS